MAEDAPARLADDETFEDRFPELRALANYPENAGIAAASPGSC